MKTLVYKGFGFDGEIEISFKISIEKTTLNKIKIEIFSNIPFRKGWGERIRNDYGNFSPEDRKKLHIAGSLQDQSYMVGIVDGVNLSLSKLNKNNDEDWITCRHTTWADVNPENLNEKMCLTTMTCSTFKKAISLIKEIVSMYRVYWKDNKSEYNNLVVELKDLKIEELLDDNPITLTLSQTVEIK